LKVTAGILVLQGARVKALLRLNRALPVTKPNAADSSGFLNGATGTFTGTSDENLGFHFGVTI
jgi:hypothetical protein